MVRRSADYCNAQLVYYTLVESYGKELHYSSGNVAANRLSQWQSTGKRRFSQAVAYLRTSSANAGPGKDNDKRQRDAITT